MSRSLPKTDKVAVAIFAREYGYIMPGHQFRLGELTKRIEKYDPQAEGLDVARRYPNQLIRVRS